MRARRNDSFLTDAWRQFLVDQSFTDAVTLTFRRPPSTDLAKRDVQHWIRRCNRAFFGRNWFRHDDRELRYAYVIEIGEGGRLHAHALLARPDRPFTKKERLWMTVIWFQRHGFAELAEIHSPDGAASYLTKTIADNGEIQIGRATKARR